MGSIEYIIAKEQTDLFRLLGGHLICAAETTGDTRKYHLSQVKVLKSCLLEMRGFWFKTKLNGPLSVKDFRLILYKHFKKDIERELAALGPVMYPWLAEKQEYILRAVEKWLLG